MQLIIELDRLHIFAISKESFDACPYPTNHRVLLENHLDEAFKDRTIDPKLDNGTHLAPFGLGFVVNGALDVINESKPDASCLE